MKTKSEYTVQFDEHTLNPEGHYYILKDGETLMLPKSDGSKLLPTFPTRAEAEEYIQLVKILS